MVTIETAAFLPGTTIGGPNNKEFLLKRRGILDVAFNLPIVGNDIARITSARWAIFRFVRISFKKCVY